MPRKIRELMADLERAGYQLVRGGKGSHRKYRHPVVAGAVTLSGKSGDDARRYQEAAVKAAVDLASHRDPASGPANDSKSQVQSVKDSMQDETRERSDK